MKLQKGFTLIELMIVVAIIAILAAVSMPVYTDYLIRGKIPEATTALALTKTAMEQYYQDNHRYSSATGGTACGINPSSTNNFSVTCAASDAVPTQTFTAAATGIIGTNVAGFSYTINESGDKTSTITSPPAPSGWASPQSQCWVTKAGAQGC